MRYLQILKFGLSVAKNCFINKLFPPAMPLQNQAPGANTGTMYSSVDFRARANTQVHWCNSGCMVP